VDIDCAKILIGILIENAARILRAGFGVNTAEHAFFAVIDLVREHPVLKQDLLDRVAITLRQSDPGLLNEGMVPRELIELVAHEMRWDELRELAEQRVRDKFRGDWSFAIGDISRGIVEAQSDSWEDRDFYQRYRAA
jgi:hypothetical protein